MLSTLTIPQGSNGWANNIAKLVAESISETILSKLNYELADELFLLLSSRTHEGKKDMEDAVDENKEGNGASEDEKKEEGIEENKKDVIKYLELYKATIRGDWKAAKSFFDNDPTTLTAIIDGYSSTALHVAIHTGLSIKFVQNLVGLVDNDILEMKDLNGDTSLHCAAIVGFTEAAKILVQKNPKLTQVFNKQSMTPIHLAAAYGHKETVCFLLSVTHDEDPSPLAGHSGLKLVILLIYAGFYGIALHLLKQYPRLALEHDTNGRTALGALAQKPHAFPSGTELGFFKGFLYICISVKRSDNFRQGGDIENPTQKSKHYIEESKKSGILRSIYNTKLMHMQSLEIVKLLCEESIKSSDQSEAEKLLGPPLLLAASFGIYEFVVEVVKAFPFAMWMRNSITGHNIFHLAILHRKEKVFSLLYQMGPVKHYAMALTDSYGNNMLHLAGKLVPSNILAGAALQMQRELQWFKEVEKVVQPRYKEMKNKYRKIPRQVFSTEHRDLVVKGEEWLKNTASSCTVVAALVATVVFAAAFTVPGGESNDTGIPIFLNETSFMIFAISDALALVTSSTSVLMFLGILTSRYAEGDFLRELPMRLAIGLITLFFSIASMLAAFGSSLHIVLVHRIEWVAFPILLLACIPLTLYVFLQFSLLVEIVSSTFGPSIFRPQSKEIII